MQPLRHNHQKSVVDDKRTDNQTDAGKSKQDVVKDLQELINCVLRSLLCTSVPICTFKVTVLRTSPRFTT